MQTYILIFTKIYLLARKLEFEAAMNEVMV
jgi:hypothetical protein